MVMTNLTEITCYASAKVKHKFEFLFLNFNNLLFIFGQHPEGETTTPCDFDEGSPLVQDDFVIGIMSKIKGIFFF